MALIKYKRLLAVSINVIIRSRYMSSNSMVNQPVSEKSSSSSDSYNETIRLRRNKLFEKERERQMRLITRIEKIKVSVKGSPGKEDETTLIMNKHLSTPYNCAMHIDEHVRDMAVLAMVNGHSWDMHRPLVEDCDVQFMSFIERDPRLVNKAYWRSGCFLLGMLAEVAFKDDFHVELHSWPSPNVRSGSFVYDIDLKLQDWKPRQDELRTMSILVNKFCSKDLPFERLEVDVDVALQIFSDNKYKREQIPAMAASNSPEGRNVVLYKVGDHVDISRGPMITRTGLVSLFNVTGVHPLTTDYGQLYRFQGVSLPKQIKITDFIWNIILNRASKLNPARVPKKPTEDIPLETPMHRSQDTSDL